MQEEDLQRGMTSGVKIKLDREKMKCDVTETNECMNRDNAQCPTTYPIVCPINYFKIYTSTRNWPILVLYGGPQPY
jgi:hypothetical protein